MRIEQTYNQKSKALLHGLQAFLIFIAGCLALGVLTKSGSTGAQIGFYFALCFLSLPALIYQVMVPMWSRAWRFANVYAYLALDLLFALLWFSAFVAVASWIGEGSCAKFAHGSELKCHISKASVAIGVFIFLLWCWTAAISVRSVLQYRRTGIVPGTATRPRTDMQEAEDPSKDAWSTHFDDREHDVDEQDERKRYGQSTEEEIGHGLLHHKNSQPDVSTEYGLHPGRPLQYGVSLQDGPSVDDDYNLATAPSALSPTSPDEHRFRPLPSMSSHYAAGQGDRVGFPVANYAA